MIKDNKDDFILLVKSFFLNKKVQFALAILLFLIILYTSTSIRLSNLPLLKDQTNGEYILADLDALYFLRLSEVVLEQGNLQGIDNMRYQPANVGYLQEIMPYVIVWMYKSVSIFDSDVSLRFINAISPAIFFAIGLVIFFILCFYLTKSKTISLIASAVLAYSPAYLFRTMAGVSDHEAIGMIPFFAAFLIFVIGLSKFEKNWKNTFIYSILTGLFTALTLAAWGGSVNFLLMILPLAFLLFYLFNIEDNNLKSKEKYLVFYAVWIFTSVLFTGLMNFGFLTMFGRFFASYGILVPFIFIFSLIDYIFEKYKFKFIRDKYRVAYSFVSTILLGSVGLMLIGKSIFEMLKSIYHQLLFPFGTGRVGLTVAENAQPYLVDLISQFTPVIFWLFLAGIILIGVEISKNIKEYKHKIYFVLSWVFAVSGILFSRISSTSLFNGENFISQAFYVLGFGLFIYYFAWLYFNDRFKIDTKIIFIFAWMLFMFISARSAVRTLFAVAPFVAFSAAYFVVKIWNYVNTKDETGKYFFYTIAILSSVLMLSSLLFVNFAYDKTQGVYSFPGAYKLVSAQAQYVGPSSNTQWQYSMDWVRKNTAEDSIFIHWWDYGYFVQTLGERPSLTDGGHAVGYWDHTTGRYLLTTPKPETALSLMKSFDISYLLIDPSDFGKYGAYSKIGGNLENDRFSAPAVLISDRSQFRETNNLTTRVYSGTTFVDEDITYEGEFLPGPTYDSFDRAQYKSYLIGTIVETSEVNGQLSIRQPKAVYFYNGKQVTIPLRYVYIEGKIVDYYEGIEAVLMLVPEVIQDTNGQISIDNVGSAIYLSPRVQKGLFARLYLMNDPYNQYPTITKGHFEDDIVVKSLKAQGLDLGDIIYFQGLRAPLKIWKVDYPSNILDREEFRALEGEYAGLDNLEFVRN